MNQHAEQSIDAYLDAEKLPVPHAILVEGAWGSGKTFFIEKIYQRNRANRLAYEAKYCAPLLIVSLFGANSAEEAQLRIYRRANPGEAMIGNLFGAAARGVGEFFRVKDAVNSAVETVGSLAVSRLNDFVLVLDDLERVEPKAFGEIMGLVNKYVAEQNRRVILIADEDKLKELQGEAAWKEQNEKIVGRRVRIEADIESVIQHSIDNLGNPKTKQFLIDRKADLAEIACQSEVKNLRSLSWALHNAVHFVELLKSDPEIPDHHIDRTMKVVIALTLWFRTAKLDDKILGRLPGLGMHLIAKSISGRAATEPIDAETGVAQKFLETFSGLKLDEPPLDYQLVSDFELGGIIDGKAVLAWIKEQYGFGKSHVEPAWRQLWYSYNRPRLATDAAIDLMATALKDRIYLKRGEILHAAGLAIKFGNLGVTKFTSDAGIVEYFKSYIDDVFAKGTLESRHPVEMPMPLEYEAYGSLGYTSRETPEFQTIVQYLTEKQQEIAISSYRNDAENIILEAEDGDLEGLFRLIQNDNPKLSQNPVLINLGLERLASFFTRDMPELDAAARLLAYRYGDVHPGSPLLEEVYWARQLYLAMMEKLDTWSEPHREMATSHLAGIVRHYDNERSPDIRISPADQPK